MRPMNANKPFIIALAVAALSVGCESGPQTNTQRGAVAGAATGAVLGGIVGHQSGETTAGAAIGAAAGGLAGAAIGHQKDRGRVTETDARTSQVFTTPPPMPTSTPNEAVPARPAAEAVWVNGYWSYNQTSGQYDWIPGHWEIPPRGMTSWVAPSWQRSGNGYIYEQGHWR